ncbi:MAG: tetratricopeptide repeat protein [Rhodobacteraceae bacterium]|nr:tetratricopeptide repeat protein [Paracoccaceae bacterium]
MNLNIKYTSYALLIWCFTAFSATSDNNAGSYLSAIHAERNNDFSSASKFYSLSLENDAYNVLLLNGAVRSNIKNGNFSDALFFSKRLIKLKEEAPITSLLMLTNAIKNEEFNRAKLLLNEPNQFNIYLEAILTGWLEIGAGNIGKGLNYFKESENAKKLGSISRNHLALALAMVGDFEKADAILSNFTNGSNLIDRESVIAHAQIMAQIGKNLEAVELLDRFLIGNDDLEISKLRRLIDAGAPVKYDYITNSKQGAALALYTVANAINNEKDYALSLIYSRLVHHIDNKNIENILLISKNLLNLEQYKLTIENYNNVPNNHIKFKNAEIGRANALFFQGKEEGSIEVLIALVRDNPKDIELHTTLGNSLRRSEKFLEASIIYNEAILLIENKGLKSWFEYYAKGICNERLGNWELAEVDFRKALAIEPNQPSLLNYFGYSLVEKGIHLEEALDLIKRAVRGQPNDGYITDSLGWALYRLGKYSEAVIHMERATELMPLDPIINDHLGDVYWAVDRHTEAEFQWRRALSFDPEEKDAKRINKKLNIGLDAVLISETE